MLDEFPAKFRVRPASAWAVQKTLAIGGAAQHLDDDMRYPTAGFLCVKGENTGLVDVSQDVNRFLKIADMRPASGGGL